MKKKFLVYLIILCLPFVLAACGCGKSCSAIELMGAGDRIHDSYTFANTGVVINENESNVYTISGSVEKLENNAVKNEFNIDEDVDHIVAIKLTAIGDDVKKDEVQITVNGSRNYDAEHLNGSDYTFILLEAIKGQTVSIGVKWNDNAETKNYVINFSNDIDLK